MGKKQHYLCLDLEMSGPVPGIHDIIQIGAVLLDENFNQLSEFETLVYPMNEEDFDPESAKVHGIPLFELDDAPSMEDAIDEMEAWIRREGDYPSRKALSAIKLCGQGVNNDISFMKASYYDVNLTWPFAYQCIDLQDTGNLYFEILKANDLEIPQRRSLDSVANFLGMQRERNKHNALEDAKLTADCLHEIYERCKAIKLN